MSMSNETLVSRGDPYAMESHVVFVNKSSRKAAIIWIDFKGNLVKYKVLDPGKQQLMTTYVDHVWLFEDVETGERLITTKRESIYVASNSPDRNKPIAVEIVIPVFPLASICMRSLRQRFSIKEIKGFAIPRLLKEELLHYCDRKPRTDYRPPRR